MNQHSVMVLNYSLVAFALFAGCRFVWLGIHAKSLDPDTDRFTQAANARDRGASAVPDYAAALVAFGVAGSIAAHALSAAVAYAVICLAMTARFVANLVFEERERARGKRAALLTPAPQIDPVLAIWIAIAAAAIFLLIPAIAEPEDRIAAIITGVSCSAMVAAAWRIAAGPRLLPGDDVEAELVLDRTRRIRRTGLTASTAAGCVFYFGAATANGVALTAGLPVWAFLLIWMLVYLRIAKRRLVLNRA